MRIYKANYLHLYRAALDLSESDRQEMERLGPGRDPIDVLTASSDDPTVKHISDDSGNVLAVGGHSDGIIWFVHTERAAKMGPEDKARMLKLLTGHLIDIKRKAYQQRPQDRFHFTNIVTTENTPHIKLLEHLGATWATQGDEDSGVRQFFF